MNHMDNTVLKLDFNGQVIEIEKNKDHTNIIKLNT